MDDIDELMARAEVLLATECVSGSSWRALVRGLLNVIELIRSSGQAEVRK